MNRHARVFLLGFGCAATLVACKADPSTSSSDPGPPKPGGADIDAPAPPTVDPDMQAVLDELAALGGKPIETLSPAEARQQPTAADAVKKVMSKRGLAADPEPVAFVEDRSIDAATATLSVRLYTPTKGTSPRALVVYYHDGGFVLGTNDGYDATPRGLANRTGAIVASVEYRKAPESKFPAAHDDAVAAYDWLVANAATLKVDPARTAVAGEGAGANLAANVAIAERDKKGVVPRHALLVYPIASANRASASYLQNADAKPLRRAMVLWFMEKYFRTRDEWNDPRINLASAELGGLPSMTVINAEIDPLRSDGDSLVASLEAASVPLEQRTYLGVTHEFFGMGAVVADARDAMDYAASRLKDALGAP